MDIKILTERSIDKADVDVISTHQRNPCYNKVIEFKEIYLVLSFLYAITVLHHIKLFLMVHTVCDIPQISESCACPLHSMNTILEYSAQTRLSAYINTDLISCYHAEEEGGGGEEYLTKLAN